MAYNRWINYSDELYHHGVKGMKWGRHLFGNGETPQAGGSGGGGLLEEEPSDEELKKAKDEYWQLYDQVHKLTPEQMSGANKAKAEALYKQYYAALDKYKAAEKSYNEKKAAYEQSASYKIKHPVETAKKALDKAGTAITNKKIDVEYAVRDKTGLSARDNYRAAKAKRRGFDHVNYAVRDEYTNERRKRSNWEIARTKREYDMTPLGKVESKIEKGKQKLSNALRKAEQKRNAERRQTKAHDRETFKRDWQRDNKEWAEMHRQESARESYAKQQAEKEKAKSHGLISRKRKVTEGTGVQLRDPVSTNNHGLTSRKRKVTEGTGVQLRDPVNSKKRPRSRKRKVTYGTGVILNGPVKRRWN